MIKIRLMNRMYRHITNIGKADCKALRSVLMAAMLLTVSGTAMAGVVVHGNVYGGGNQADVKTNTEVNMRTGQVEGNVYGGGNVGSVGTYTTSGDMKTFTFTENTGACSVTIDGGTIGTGVDQSTDGTFADGNVYGAGKGEADTYWCEKAMSYKTTVIINAGIIGGTVYGGGQIGRVENDATVTIGAETPTNDDPAPTIAGNVFGAGAGQKTHGYSALLRGDAKVTVQGNARIGLNVYGGGEKASVGRFKIVGGLPSEPAGDGSGDCTVNIRGNAVIGTNTDDNITDKGNVFGTCQGVEPPASFSSEYDKNYRSMQTDAQKAPSGTEGTAYEYVKEYAEDYTGEKYYWEYYPTLDAYKGFLNTLALASHPVVTVGGALSNETTGTVTVSGNPTVNGSVFGGGQRGITLGTVAVNIVGGTVNHDVYGGGALADTNKGNQTAEKYDVATVTVGETDVTEMYERSGAGTDLSPYVYTATEDTEAEEDKTYYIRAAQSSINTTTVNLTGGTIKGDAYGGGLGQKDGFNGKTGNVEATVWGDINVNLGSSNGTTATAFYLTNYTDEDHTDVAKSGRVFGCNNLLGSPQGNVTVTVWRTVTGKDGDDEDVTRTAASAKGKKVGETGYVAPTYELAAVYGGGNLANYAPIASGKKASVIIETCEVSVHSVYGGGNAAAVPETDVLVNGAYEIAEVFGGGNGKDQYTTDNGTTWVSNSGADVNGDATTLLKGGYIHEAYGGSNSKGTISGNVSINKSSGGACTLQVDDLYGAGKDADIEGDLIMVMGCSETRTENVYGCSKNANVKGNVELTITSGEYGKVFGGNNESGSIFGHIIVNIEETGCSPIIIDELYGCGNNAAYSVYGYYKAKKYEKTVTGEDNQEEVQLFLDADKTIPLYEDNDHYYKDAAKTIRLYKDDEDFLYINVDKTRPLYMPRQSASDTNPIETFSEWPHTTPNATTHQYDDPQVNIISCTHIGKVFGGGLGTGAVVYGNPKVNINMIAGAHANSMTTNTTENPNKLGEIGTVYGGGNAADVIGDPTVNIGTVAKVKLHQSYDATTIDETHDGYSYSAEQDVVGAYIIGNVFGGGKGEADNFFCDKAMIGKDGDGIANPTGGTYVYIYKGFVRGNVYGGGEVGRVEKNTVVTIGTGDGVAAGGTPTSAPIIMGNVFGGGGGVKTHGYSALVRGNPTVTVQGNAKVRGNVYGGGEIASVARYNVPRTEGEVQAAIAAGYTDAVLGIPYALKDETSGTCRVTIQGYAEIGPETIDENATTTSVGHVFGAGKGVLPNYVTTGEDEEKSRRMVLYDANVHTGSNWEWVDPDHSDTNKNIWEYFASESAYITFVKSLALSSRTYVTVAGNALVKGSVFGGSESGFVQFNTDVKVTGGTIGVSGKGGADFGNVYGGGKGDVQYTGGNHDYVDAGIVRGNTEITISETDATNHPTQIYHNIYGGGAYGSVGKLTYSTPEGSTQPASTPSSCENGTGTATINITGGTIGINGCDNGMVFGSSRGDVAVPEGTGTDLEDPNNKLAWVNNTYVTIGTTNSGSNPWIRGSVYGSGENGHVLNNTNVVIHSGKIGIEESDGSTYDIEKEGVTYKGAGYGSRGNVYGGGCGTDTYDVTTVTGENAVTKHYFNRTAGVVRGNATIIMDGGKVVRTIYGGGAMGSVGKFNRNAKTTDDPYYSDPHVHGFISSCAANTGLCSVTISGGQVGPSDATIPDGAGNVFGASRGEIHDATFYPNLDRKAYADNTEVSISGTATIKGSVYGGGETGNVIDNTEVNVCVTKQTSGETVTYVAASGSPTIGGNVYGGGKGSDHNFTCDKAMVGLVDQGVDADNNLQPGGTAVRIYNGTVGTLVGATGSQTLKAGTGNVYGGGEIARVERNTVVEIGAASGTTEPTILGSVFAAGAGLKTHGYSALVRGTSTVTVQGSAKVKKNVYGGGEMASVGRYKVKIANRNPADAPDDLPNGMPYGLKAGGTTYVVIQGSAEIGTANVATTGHVYGAGQGVEPGNYDYLTKAEFEEIAANAGKTYNQDEHQPKRMIGNNTWEYFGSLSAYHQYLETLAISATTDVTIGEEDSESTKPTIMGSVFGGSESGFVYRNTDVKIQGGTVNGDAFGGGRGLASFAEAGRVRWNTNLTVSGGTVEGNVYGGGNLGDVGTIYKPADSHDYVWRNTDANGNNMDDEHNNTSGNNAIVVTDENPNTNTGLCTVTISGGTIGIDDPDDKTKHGNVFGAGEGLATTFWCEKAIAFATNVSISGSSTTVNGNVYGGGEVGRIEDDVKVMVGTASESDEPTITGSVFGGGAGVETHGYSALVRGNTTVNVEGQAKVGHSVYGGGEIASVGKYGLDEQKMPSILKGGGYCYVTVQGNATIADDVFGAGEGVKSHFDNNNSDRSKRSRRMTVYSNSTDFPEAHKYTANAESYTWEYCESYLDNYQGPKFVWDYLQTPESYSTYLETLALATHPEVTIDGSASIGGSVFGGGELGLTKGSVIVNIQGGTIAEDVYGGGSLANTNTTTKADLNNDGTLEDYTPTTTVKLKSGTINRNVYGGGLGQLEKDAVDEVLYTAEDAEVIAGTKQAGDVKTPGVAAQSDIPAKVYGTVTVELNKPVTTTTGEGESATTTTTYGDCVVKGNIFGCNNLNGSPQKDVTVHVYSTTDYTGHEKDATKSNSKFNVNAVYGGGNLAAYYPDDATARGTATANVIIDGCDLTSIGTVYGGGNAASVPATEVTVNSAYEIGEVYGGGNGKDNYQLDGLWYENPGANVGYKDYTHKGTETGTEADPIKAVDNTTPDCSTKESRITNYGTGYGTGKAHATIYGGTVHAVYGGSNSKGNIRVEARATLEDAEECEFNVGEAYGGGHNAKMDGDAILDIGCISGMDKACGGAANADVNGNVVLNITNGTYGQVFGGNDLGGLIRGSITVNIEETGCRPIIIGELYGGGNQARYSVFGYDASGNVLTSGSKVADPQVNVHSFTAIGNIFGGGYGAPATMVGDPQVNINVTKGKYYDYVGVSDKYGTTGYTYDANGYKGQTMTIGSGQNQVSVTVPDHKSGAIGAINTVFGGGNAAEVIGTPHVNIGTEVGDEVYEPVTATITAGTTSVADYFTVAAATGTAVAGTTYYEKIGGRYRPVTVAEGAAVTSYYTVAAATGTAVASTTYYEKKTVAVDIRGNVYGGGNNAQVTGNTNVVIGKERSE